MNKEELLRMYDEDDMKFTFSNSMELDDPDNELQDLINDDMDEEENAYIEEYHKRLQECKDKVMELRNTISKCRTVMNDSEILLQKINEEKNSLKENIESIEVKNMDTFVIYKGVKGRDQLTSARSYMIDHFPFKYESLIYGEEYKAVVVLDKSVDKDYVLNELHTIDKLEDKLKCAEDKYKNTYKIWRRASSEKEKLTITLDHKRDEYYRIKKNNPYKGISRCYIRTNIYIDEVDFGKTLKNAFGPNGVGYLNGIKL